MNKVLTELTCLTDSASNWWSITKLLQRHSKKLINVLNKFYITGHFTVDCGVKFSSSVGVAIEATFKLALSIAFQMDAARLRVRLASV